MWRCMSPHLELHLLCQSATYSQVDYLLLLTVENEDPLL